MSKFFVFIIGFVISLLMLRFRYQIKNFTGDIGFAEKYLGVGGTHIFIILLALAVFIISLTYATGTLQGFIGSIFGGFF